MANNVRYIVVVFHNGVGYTYQTDDNIRWFFTHNAVTYKKSSYAKQRAEKLGRKYPNCKVCVFKTELNERLSCDQYHDWYKDDNRMMFEFLYNN